MVSISQLKSFYRQVFSMDLFLLPRDVRCLLVCILLGAVKIDKDDKEVGLSFYCIHVLKVSLMVRMSLCKQYNQSDLKGTPKTYFCWNSQIRQCSVIRKENCWLGVKTNIRLHSEMEWTGFILNMFHFGVFISFLDKFHILHKNHFRSWEIALLPYVWEIALLPCVTA